MRYFWTIYRREPYSLLKPPKRSKSEKGDQTDDDNIMEKLEKKKAKAIRHIILIRHGQYNMKGENDKERYLTGLGQEQAVLTGKRLKNSGIDFHSIICSNMTRAMQTAELILKELGRADLCIETQDPVLREGAPCLPEPPVSNWHPDLHVTKQILLLSFWTGKVFAASPKSFNAPVYVFKCLAVLWRWRKNWGGFQKVFPPGGSGSGKGFIRNHRMSCKCHPLFYLQVHLKILINYQTSFLEKWMIQAHAFFPGLFNFQERLGSESA